MEDFLQVPGLGELCVRSLSREDFGDTAMRWALQEGWNPGIADTDIFYESEPEAHLGLELKGRIIGSGSIPSYEGGFGFMGLFIMSAEFRGQGIGKALWYYRRDCLLRRLRPGAAIGMDGVFAMQDFYHKGGFEFSHRNLRMQGLATDGMVDPSILPCNAEDFEIVSAYDERHFGFPRKTFLKLWLHHPLVKTLKYNDGTAIRGLVSFRPCAKGYKIGPLFADDSEIAMALLQAVMSLIPGEVIFLDIPENNADALTLAASFSLNEVFGCARMYYGHKPLLPWGNIYGITTFEMG